MLDGYSNIACVNLIASLLARALCSKNPCNLKDVIIFCYSRQNVIKTSGIVSPLLTWHICKIIVDYFSLVITCVLRVLVTFKCIAI